MSWDATLYQVTEVTTCHECSQVLPEPRQDRDEVGWWNYTHNTNGMIAKAYEAVTGTPTEQCDGPLGPAIGAAWWRKLSGANGSDGKEYLSAIITGLEADPAAYQAMNPPNGWGDYDGLLDVLRRMRDAHEDGCRYVWHVSG